MNRVLILLFLCPSLGMSDEVYFKSSASIRNVVIANEPVITMKGKGFVQRYRLDDIETIRKSEFDLTEFPSISNRDKLPDKVLLPRIETEDTTTPDNLPMNLEAAAPSRPNLKLLPISVIAFGLTWDFLARASDAGKAIDEINKRPPDVRGDTSDLEALRTRTTILGIACGVAGIINIIITVSPVEVTATSSSFC